MLNKKLSYVLLCIGVITLMSGCLRGEQTLDEIDVPEEITLVDDEVEVSDESDSETDEELSIQEEVEPTEATVVRELYLFDRNGLVVPQTFELPKTEAAASQVLEYLVVDGPITELLPNGFQAVIPAGTEILGVNIQDDGTLIVDFSEEFTHYNPDDEVKILQAITYTLTQFENVKRIKIWLNGENLEEMPVGGTPIANGISKENGINIHVTNQPDVAETKPVTVYFPKGNHEEKYFVPITQYIEAVDKYPFDSMIQAMLDGPDFELQAIQVFNDDTELIGFPRLENGVLEVEFNEEILTDKKESILSRDVAETIVRTLTEFDAVDSVELKVQRHEKLVDEHGNEYQQPMSKDDLIHTIKM